MALVEVKVPDIGDFDEVAVIELLVKPGDTVTAEQSLITVESDKASMEIPSSQAGVVKELKVEARRQGQGRLAGAGAGGAGEPLRRTGRLPRPAPRCRRPQPRRRQRRRQPAAPAAAARPGRSRCMCPTSATSRMWP